MEIPLLSKPPAEQPERHYVNTGNVRSCVWYTPIIVRLSSRTCIVRLPLILAIQFICVMKTMHCPTRRRLTLYFVRFPQIFPALYLHRHVSMITPLLPLLPYHCLISIAHQLWSLKRYFNAPILTEARTVFLSSFSRPSVISFYQSIKYCIPALFI